MAGDHMDRKSHSRAARAVRDFARKWGQHAQQDLRMAIATLLLEHLLELTLN
jgi:hypothetical protein